MVLLLTRVATARRRPLAIFAEADFALADFDLAHKRKPE